ncbi:MAG TPA: methyltransferase domain-containing protein [Candidatus Acidoferrum sp.]|nr:methyltransferase domain-containing protein [Candidatus Acidoferrum sp.]
MSATAKTVQSNPEMDQLKAKLKVTWNTGDYDKFCRYMEKDAAEFYQGLGVNSGAKLLDVACGAGQLALIAARAGAQVTGCDIAPNWIEKAKARAAKEKLSIQFEEGDAEALPYQAGQFDVVVSLIGAMFAPRPELVAAELTRVCKPGGIIAMANWTPQGFIGQMFKTIAKHIAPSGMPSPVLWGDEETVRDRLREGIGELKFARRRYHFDYPFSPSEVVDFFRENYGPMTCAFASLDADGQQTLHAELTQLWSSHNRAGGIRTRVDAEYLEVIAIRANSVVSRRAAALAGRIEEGAAALASFAEGLSEAEWRAPGSKTGIDRRSVGVIVHHVASMYPIEVDAARAVAGGKFVAEITWEVVAGINAKHAAEQASAGKVETLELLRRNAREAGAAVRSFSDEELDRAAAFGLSYGAPMTAQFVIEDHAVRHSWHHLARIREALGN